MSVTVSPSWTVWSSPAEAVGGLLGMAVVASAGWTSCVPAARVALAGTSVMVMVAVSVVVALWLSVTLRVKVMAVSVSTWGAVNEGASVSPSEMDRPGWSEVQP